jgi:hypothetical protein
VGLRSTAVSLRCLTLKCAPLKCAPRHNAMIASHFQRVFRMVRYGHDVTH